jgi:hypothetical protein
LYCKYCGDGLFCGIPVAESTGVQPNSGIRENTLRIAILGKQKNNYPYENEFDVGYGRFSEHFLK